VNQDVIAPSARCLATTPSFQSSRHVIACVKGPRRVTSACFHTTKTGPSKPLQNQLHRLCRICGHVLYVSAQRTVNNSPPSLLSRPLSTTFPSPFLTYPAYNQTSLKPQKHINHDRVQKCLRSRHEWQPPGSTLGEPR
jgi:hypothetical protein